MPPFDCQRRGASIWAVRRTQASLRQNKRQREFAGFAVKVPGMRVVGVFEGPFALDARFGFRLRINEPKFGWAPGPQLADFPCNS